MPNLIGQSFGRYHILEQLGEGGMAVVYKAFDTRLERNVAIKVILPGKEHSEKFLKRFEREAKSLAGLSHPNIVKVIDYGEHEGLPYLVMEYLPGGTLKGKLNGKPMPWRDSVRILLPIARALAYAHKQKIVHRDLKPSNILITASGEPMLSDFGIAKIVEAEETMDLTGTGVGIGTPEYMSPEQAQGGAIDGRSDVYSLGVVLYELVTGRKPYQADTPYAVVIKHVSAPLPRPKQFVRDLPDFLEQKLVTALAKSPSDRFSDMSVFADALEEMLTSTRTQVVSDGKNRRQKPLLALGIISLVALLVFVFSGLYRSQTANPDLSVTATLDEPLAATEDRTMDSLGQHLDVGVDLTTFDTEIDTNLWLPVAKDSDTVVLQNGILIITNESNTEDVASLYRRTYLKQDKINFVETKMLLGGGYEGYGGDISFQLVTTLNNGQNLIIWCGIYRGLLPQSGCEVYGRTDNAEYMTPKKAADYNAWHTFRMELDSDLTISFYIDDQPVGSYTPSDAANIKDRNFNLRLDTWSPEEDGIQGQFDDVRIGTSE